MSEEKPNHGMTVAVLVLLGVAGLLGYSAGHSSGRQSVEGEFQTCYTRPTPQERDRYFEGEFFLDEEPCWISWIDSAHPDWEENQWWYYEEISAEVDEYMDREYPELP